MTLTNRLSLYFLTALALILTSFSTALYLLADRHLTRQLDDRLGAAARTLASAAEVDPDGVEWEPRGRPLALAPGAFGDQLHWSVTTDDGRVIERSPQIGTDDLMTRAEEGFRTGHRNPRRLDHDRRAWQVMRLRLESDQPGTGPVAPEKYPALILTAAVPLDPVHDTLWNLAAALATLGLGVLLIAIFAGRMVCRRALAPVGRMAAAARAMGAADLTDRLPVPASADELADLALDFNGLLNRLGESFERERRFAGEASHQLRTPLAAVIGQVEVALRRERDPAEYRRVLGAVLDQAGRLRRVVEALLFLARTEGDAELPGLEQLELVAWARDRVSSWGEHSRSDDLRFEPSDVEAARVVSHPDLLGELLDALLDNALKYSAPGTPVVVRVGCDASGTWVEVEDRGCGIADADLPNVFRPFFRSETARKQGIAGVGLGLAVASRIARALNGELRVESTLGRGSRVRLHFGTRSAANERVVQACDTVVAPIVEEVHP